MKLKRTHSQFIEKLEEKYPDREYEVLETYEHNKTPILVKGKYGECLLTPSELMMGRSPSVRNAVDPRQYSINRFNEVHGNKYDYSKFEYTGCLSTITVI